MELLLSRVESKADFINMRDAKGQTALHVSARTGLFETVKALLANDDTEVNAATGDWQKATALHIAAERGLVGVTTVLLWRPDIDVNAVDILNYTPLLHASFTRHVEVVRLLLKHPQIKEDVAGTSSSDRHFQVKYKNNLPLFGPLTTARRRGYRDVVRVFLEHAVFFSAQREREGPFLDFSDGLVTSEVAAHLSKTLRQWDVDPETSQVPLQSVYFWAVFSGHKALIETILYSARLWVNVNRPLAYNGSPLIWSVVMNRLDILELLLNKEGIDVNNSDGSLVPLVASLEQNSSASFR